MLLSFGLRVTRGRGTSQGCAILLEYNATSYYSLLQTKRFGASTYGYWRYLATGVELFFVLSGFLLFLPYARAMLHAETLPSARRFYQRRALRILPAYYVCLTILAILPTSDHRTQLSVGDIVTHVLFIHDGFHSFNRDLEGPFWTLAIEAQFYLLLPLMAAGISRLVGASRSRCRLVACLFVLIAIGVALRKVDGMLAGLPSSYSLQGWSIGSVALVFILLTYGMQGKFIEVFAIGMLCSVIYIIAKEDNAWPRNLTKWLG
jgi:peptidoglycan/LPS O-acetylase OafA/YrhL